MLAEDAQGIRLREEMQNGRRDVLGALHLLELELVAPGDQRSPEELVGGDDDRHHGHQAPEDGVPVAGIGGRLEVGPESGETEVAGTEVEHLARHQEEPGARNGHDRVPDQADRGVRKFELHQALQAGEAVDGRRLDQLARDALERGVEAEGHVPHGAREDEHDGAQLNADVPGREEPDHGQHHAGKKAQDGDRLQDVEHRDHEDLVALVVGREIAVTDRRRQG